MNRREAILEGTQAAQRLHLQLGSRELLERAAKSHVDVFRVAIELGALLLFRPLKGILGAYLGKPDYPIPGIIVSTQRNLHTQRFTAAHELGHLVLGHKMPSLDEQVGLWRSETKDLNEVAADAFASEFLLPQWLYVHHARRNQWGTAALKHPETVYQLSLRLAASYEATCWGLSGHGILDSHAVDVLRQYAPKALKKAAIGENATLENPWANVWVVTEADDGLTLEGGPEDIIVFRIRERASAGYLWDETCVSQGGLDIVTDSRKECEAGTCGGDVERVLVARAREAVSCQVLMSERRPWLPDDALSSLSIAFDFGGKEEGLPRIARKVMAAA